MPRQHTLAPTPQAPRTTLALLHATRRTFARKRRSSARLPLLDGLPSDAAAGLAAVRTDFDADLLPGSGLIAFALRSQVYAVVADRAEVDTELDRMRRAGLERFVRVGSEEDVAVVAESEYRRKLDGTAGRALLRALEKENRRAMWIGKAALEEAAGRAADSTVKQLVRSGWLENRREGGFWIGMPGLGALRKARAAGNRELKTLLARRPYREMLLSDVEQLHLRKSPFGVTFHLRDMLGAGTLEVIRTTAAPLVRLCD